MKEKRVYIYLIFLFFCTCQQSKQDRFKGGIIINLDTAQEIEIRTSNLFKSVRPIILETKSESLIANVSEILVFDEKMFIFDNRGKSLLVFDMDGKFIRRIGGIGKGPGEYTLISDFTIDPEKREIYVLVNAGRIHKYNVDGAYVNSIQISREDNVPNFKYIQYFDGKIYSAANQLIRDNYHILYQIDPKTGKILKGYFSLEDNLGWNLIVGQAVFFNRLHGIPKFIYPCMNTIISLDNVAPFMILKSEKWVHTSEIEKIKQQTDQLLSWQQLVLKKKAGVLQNYMETKDRIFFCYFENMKIRTAMYHKDEQSIYLANPFINDLLYEQRKHFDFRYTDEKGAYEVILMEQFFMSKDLFLGNDHMRKQLQTLNEESNPVIFFYEFK